MTDPFDFADMHQDIHTIDYYKAEAEAARNGLSAAKDLLDVRDKHIQNLQSRLQEQSNTNEWTTVLLTTITFFLGMLIGHWLGL